MPIFRLFLGKKTAVAPAPAVTKRLAGPRRVLPRIPPALFKAIFDRVKELEVEEDEPVPAPVKRRVRAVAKAAIADAGILAGRNRTVERKVREFYTPQVTLPKLEIAYSQLVKALIDEAMADADDEDVIMLM